MRFDRRRRVEGSTWTARKEAAFLQRHKRLEKRIERDYPLFTVEFAPAPETDVEAEKARRDRMALKGDQDMRDLCAKHWRSARAAYFACPPAVRAQITDEWRRWRGPAEAGYFRYVVEKHNGAAEEKAQQRRARDDEMRARIVELDGVQPPLSFS